MNKEYRIQNIRQRKSTKFHFIIVLSFVLLSSCAENYSPEEKKYIAEVEQSRKEKDDYMKNDPNSPFNLKGKVSR